MTLLEIVLILLILVGIVVCVFLVVSLKKINQSLNNLLSDLKVLNSKIEPIIENLKIITDKAVSISDETERRVLDISNTIQNVRNTISKFTFRDSKISANRSPIQDLLNNLTAVSKGVSTFWKKLNN
jgi:uncharacterized protein YoxC